MLGLLSQQVDSKVESLELLPFHYESKGYAILFSIGYQNLENTGEIA